SPEQTGARPPRGEPRALARATHRARLVGGTNPPHRSCPRGHRPLDRDPHFGETAKFTKRTNFGNSSEINVSAVARTGRPAPVRMLSRHDRRLAKHAPRPTPSAILRPSA